MNQTAIKQIERSIFALPEAEQHRLISRLAGTLRKRAERENDFDAKLLEMASDPQIQRELKDIERDFRVTEFDGLDR